MPLEPCLDCGAPVVIGQRCTSCGQGPERRRDLPPGPRTLPRSPCLECGAPTTGNVPCANCGRKATRPDRNWGRGSTAGWKPLRAAVLKRDPVCRICGTNPSTRADHWPIARRMAGLTAWTTSGASTSRATESGWRRRLRPVAGARLLACGMLVGDRGCGESAVELTLLDGNEAPTAVIDAPRTGPEWVKVDEVTLGRRRRGAPGVRGRLEDRKRRPARGRRSRAKA